jgi:hypothetical protein
MSNTRGSEFLLYKLGERQLHIAREKQPIGIE